MTNGVDTRRAGPGSRSTAIVLGLLLVAVAVMAQATLASRVRFFGASANLLLVLIVSWGLLRGVSAALPVAFICGLGLDLLSGLPLGTSALGLMAGSLVVGLGTNRVFASNLILPVLLVAAATPIYAFVVLLTLQLRGFNLDWAQIALRVVAPETVLNSLLILLVYPIMRRLDGARE